MNNRIIKNNIKIYNNKNIIQFDFSNFTNVESKFIYFKKTLEKNTDYKSKKKNKKALVKKRNNVFNLKNNANFNKIIYLIVIIINKNL